MLSYWQKFWRVEILAVLSLLVFSCLVATYLVVENLFQTEPLLGPISVAWLGWAYAFLVGLFFVNAIGVPAYCAYTEFRWFSMPLLLLVAVTPGVALLFGDFVFGAVGVIGGLSIALSVDFLAKRWTGIRSAEAA